MRLRVCSHKGLCAFWRRRKAFAFRPNIEKYIPSKGRYPLSLKNSILNYRKKFPAGADATITLERKDLCAVLTGRAKLGDLAKDGKAAIEQFLFEIARQTRSGCPRSVSFIFVI